LDLLLPADDGFYFLPPGRRSRLGPRRRRSALPALHCRRCV